MTSLHDALPAGVGPGMKRAAFTVNAPGILLEAQNDYVARPDPVVGMVMGLSMIRAGLSRIAARSIELGDAELLSLLTDMGCIHGTGAKA